MLADKTPTKNTILFVCLNNYAGVLLKTPSKTLLIDPVDIKAKIIPQLDAILVTHEHYDHLDQQLIAELQKTTNCTVIADQTSRKNSSNSSQPAKLTPTTPGDKTKIGEVTIKTEKCKHPAGSPVTYIITTEDGHENLAHSRQPTIPRNGSNRQNRTTRRCLLHSRHRTRNLT